MSLPERTFNKPVAEMIFSHQARPGIDVSIPITPGFRREFGRSTIQEMFGLQDLTVSKHHLRCHCNVFDPSETDERFVRPMTYVQTLSRVTAQLCPSVIVCSLVETEKISNICSPYLLSHGNILHISATVSITYREIAPEGGFSAVSDQTLVAESQRFAHEYKLTKRVLGSGTFGTVFLATEQSSGRQVACKVVPVRSKKTSEDSESARLKQRQRRIQLERECSILQLLDHPNIVRLKKVICASYNIYFVKELLPGGDLSSFIIARGPLNEPCSISIVWQMLQAVKYMHQKGIAHRDIKAENILLTSWSDGARVVLTDFGGAYIDPEASDPRTAKMRMHTDIGTDGYRAPEVRKQITGSGYTQAADMWSIGCLSTFVLTSDILFSPSTWQTLSQKLCNSQKVSSDHEAKMRDVQNWKGISSMAKEFVRACLVLDPEKRPTATQALAHQWITHPIYVDEMRNACERAIQGWQPRADGVNLLEHIDTTHIQASHQPQGASDKSSKEARFQGFNKRNTASARLGCGVAVQNPGQETIKEDLLPPERLRRSYVDDRDMLDASPIDPHSLI